MSNISQDAKKTYLEILDALAQWGIIQVADPLSVIKRFFNKLDPAFKGTVRSLSDQIALMLPQNRATVCIPVVAFDGQEEDTICKTLAELEKQEFREFEVLCFCNWPEGEFMDRTPEIIREFDQTANIPVHVVCKQIASENMSAGFYRSLMHAIVLHRTLRAGIPEVIHISLDADTPVIATTMVGAYVNELSVPDVDVVVGQLDWDDPEIPTTSLPALFVGNELMRLLPRHGNWRILEGWKQGIGTVDSVLEAVFSPRSFGRGIQANLAWKGSVYARTGGYRPEAHDELDFIVRKILEVGGYKNVSFLWKEVAIRSDSRRAIWAMVEGNNPPMRQWERVPFLTRDRVRMGLPELNGQRNLNLDLILEQINRTLEVFNLPEAELKAAVCRSLEELGLGPGDYDLVFTSYEPDPVLSVAQVIIRDNQGLFEFLQRARAQN